jgi:LPXTG-motif cell wall-anchored protein
LIVIDKEEVVTAEFEPPQTAPSEEIQSSNEQTLPKTAGNSVGLLVTAAMMLGAGLLFVSWSRRGAWS